MIRDQNSVSLSVTVTVQRVLSVIIIFYTIRQAVFPRFKHIRRTWSAWVPFEFHTLLSVKAPSGQSSIVVVKDGMGTGGS